MAAMMMADAAADERKLTKEQKEEAAAATACIKCRYCPATTPIPTATANPKLQLAILVHQGVARILRKMKKKKQQNNKKKKPQQLCVCVPDGIIYSSDTARVLFKNENHQL